MHFASSDFESLAVGILESSSDYGESKTNQILLRQIYEFDRKNTLQIAYSGESLKFLGNTRCQKVSWRPIGFKEKLK